MAALAEVIEFPAHPLAAPRCAQCKTKMVLQRIEPDPLTDKDVHTYTCQSCGLAERVETR